MNKMTYLGLVSLNVDVKAKTWRQIVYLRDNQRRQK
jgi:predicted component of type VI protein secretion system